MFKEPFSFKGKIKRTEYALSLLIAVLISYLFELLLTRAETIFAIFVYLLVLWFILAQGAKRCHDLGKSGWMQIVPFYNIVMLFESGNSGINKYSFLTKFMLITSITLTFISVFLAVFTYNSIQNEIDRRSKSRQLDALIIGRLDTLRIMQNAFFKMNDKYAISFDELFDFMRKGRYEKLDSMNNIDSNFSTPMKEILGSEQVNLESFKMVPPKNITQFVFKSGKMYYNKVLVPVFEISEPVPYNYKGQPWKIGSLDELTSRGNW